jgi:microcystin-dependent protein
MGEPFIGEIRMFGGSFAPAGWAFCNGATMPIAENDVLFTLIGTTYGGDGQETFNLPDLQGRVPMHQGQGPGISQNYVIGEKAGVESVTLTAQQIPVHTHPMMASGNAGQQPQPTNGFLALTNPGFPYVASSQPFKQLNAGSVAVVGGSQPHDNMAPYLAISFIISLSGVFPSQG